MAGAEAGGGAGIKFVHGRSRTKYAHRPSHPYYAGMETSGFHQPGGAGGGGWGAGGGGSVTGHKTCRY